MTSLRARIEAKARRTVTLPLAVGNVTAAAAVVTSANVALEEHLDAVARRRQRDPESAGAFSSVDTEQEATLRADLAAAIERAGEGVVMVELQSVPDEEWDTLFGDLEPDADGEVPLDDCRAAMLAACAVDPELQDEQWWTEQLARPEWSKGDVVSIDYALLRLNQSAPTGAQGKG